MRHLTALILSLTACGSVVRAPGTEPEVDGGSADSDAPGAPAVDAPGTTARCDRTRPFGVPTRLDVFDPLRLPGPSLTLSGDELAAVVSEGGELRLGLRPDLASEFPTPTTELFANVNVGIALAAPTITADALHVYYLGEEGFLEHAGRPDLTAPFVPDGRILVGNQNVIPGAFQIAADGQTIYFIDLNDSLLHAATAVDPITFNARRVETTMPITTMALAPDERTLYYSGGVEVLVSTRTTLDRLFEPGVAQAEVTGGTRNVPLVVTADDCELYFASDRDQVDRTDVFRARRGL
jgi:hypothetical protein